MVTSERKIQKTKSGGIAVTNVLFFSKEEANAELARLTEMRKEILKVQEKVAADRAACEQEIADISKQM